MSSMSSPPNDREREAQEHLDEMTCMLYLERQLERTRALGVSAHTQSCDACRTLLRAMERESRLLTRAMLEEEEPLPARIAAFQERVHRSMQWVWMVVFGLSATAVYAMYTGYIEPWEQRLETAGLGGTRRGGCLYFSNGLLETWGAGKDIEIDGHVTGDLISAGRTVWIRGQVDGNVRSAGNTVNVIGKVGKNMTYFGDTIRIDEKGAVGGSITMFGSDMNIEGRLGRDVLFMGDRVIVNGTVGGSIDEKGANLEIGSKAQIDGPVRFEGENEPAVSSGAKLASPVRFTKHRHN